MRIKLFTADTMPQAMAQIRATLGPEAVILNSRRVTGGVEVTAARDEPPEPPPTPIAPSGCPLLNHGTPEWLAAKLRAGPLPFAISVVFRFQPLDTATHRRPVMLVGPPGAGKTLTIARLATRLVLDRQRPEVLTADTRRAGAFEQLAAFTGLLNIPLHGIGESPLSPGPVLVDTPGLCPFTAADRDELATLIRHTGALPVLVLPGGIDPGEALELAEAFAACGATRLIATRLPFAEAGIGPSAADGLAPMTADLLARRLQRPTQRAPR